MEKRTKSRPGMCCTVTMIVLGVLLLALGLVLLIAFPISLFPALVKSQIPLKENVDGSYTKLTGFWQNLPQLATYDFYFFNITNIDEIIYEGAKPHVVEVGPYSYMETEFKEGLDWRDDNVRVYYRSNKTWVFQQENSCEGCTEDDIVTTPNTAYATSMAMKVQNGMDSASTRPLDLLMQITGEDPFASVRVGGMLFDSYDDPMLDFINSNLTKLLIQLGGDGTLGGIPVPDVPYMGYFPHYNHTNDEDYILRTGRDDPMMAFQIEKWAGLDRLSWWSGQAAEFKGAGDGTFYKPFIQEGDILKNFQSFSCRAFDMEISGHEKWTGIDATVFTFPEDTYDSNKEKNIGYRYENIEHIDYFPDWPTCHYNHSYDPNLPDCQRVDCRFDYNFCNNCCDGSHYERTIFMPPGIVPLRCFPGQNKRLPFAGFLSPPHYSASPDQVVNAVVGLHPDPNGKHIPGKWWINTVTGGTVHAIFNMQLSIPIYNDADFMATSHMANCFIPSFWTHIDANLKPYAHDFIVFSAQTVPSIALGLGISFVILAVLFLLISICCYRRGAKKGDDEEEVHAYSFNVTTTDENANAKNAKATPAPLERRHSPSQMYPELYGKDSTDTNLSWKSKTLKSEGSTGEAWS